MARPGQNGLTPEQMNAFVEQQIVNTRILAIKHAQKLAGMRSANGEMPDVDALIADANKIAAYFMNDLEGLKKKSGLVITSQMPPPGAGFKPGE